MQLTSTIALLGLLLTAPSAVLAHEGHADGHWSADLLLTGWTADPATLVPILIATIWYAAGAVRARREGRSEAVPPGRCLAFAGGITVLIIALQSPIDTLSEDLFSVHMVQHLLLMLAAPPLLVWSDCPLTFLRALPPGVRKAIGRYWAESNLNRVYNALMHPLVVWASFCGAFVFWHSPGPYQWALDSNPVHIAEHLCFFLTSLAFWSIVLSRPGERRRLQHGPTLLFVVSTAVLSGLPGALMIFSPRPLYPGHAAGVARWGLTLMQDQQLAGLIMWIPAGAAYVLASAFIFLRWLSDAELRATRAARRGLPVILVLALSGLLLCGCGQDDPTPIANFNGDPHRGAALIQQYGCGGCHTIPNVAHANANVGPPLQRIGTRTYIAGVLNNSPENMALWIENPQKILPGNAMPALGISQKDSRDITAFLYGLK
jgi:cytochrome c oxidase assembly factor CtaG/cytochrome c2